MKKQADMAFLLMILLLLSASVGILHTRKKSIEPLIVDKTRIILDVQDAIDYIQPYLMSSSIDSAVTVLYQFKFPLLIQVLDTILEDKTLHLTLEQKIQLLAAALLYKKDRITRKALIDRMLKHYTMYPLFIPMLPYYAKAIPIVVKWGQTNETQLGEWIDRSLNEAVEKDDPELLSGLYTAGIRPDSKKASQLLYTVAQQNKQTAFVPLLVTQLQADISFSPDGKRTPLIAAVEQNNAALVGALIKQGSDPEKVLDPIVGSARQIAFERGYAPIELILKKIRE